MNRIQKISWLMVICIGIAMIVSTIAVTILYFKVGFPKAWTGFAFMGLGGLGGFGPIIFKKDPSPIQADERDRLINLKAAQAAFTLSYLVFGLLCMGIWGYYHHREIETITINILPWLFMAAGFTTFFTHALMILLLYGKDNKSMEEGAA